jgi:hypothetical protein
LPSGTFLSDPDRTVQKDLDIQQCTDPDHNPMIPHTLVLKPGLVIHRIYNGYWFLGTPVRRRPLARPACLTSEIRPVLGFEHHRTPRGPERGDLSPFHGLNKGAKAVPVGRREDRTAKHELGLWMDHRQIGHDWERMADHTLFIARRNRLSAIRDLQVQFATRDHPGRVGPRISRNQALSHRPSTRAYQEAVSR